MAFAEQSTYMGTIGNGSIIGGFYEKDFGNFFEYSDNIDPLDSEDWTANDLPHLIWVGEPIKNLDSGFRYGIVKKTVAYIVIDEDEFGKPVFEKWFIKNNFVYPR